MHGLLLSQEHVTQLPPTHLPLLHLSVLLQLLPSLQPLLLGVCWQPVTLLQVSFVQLLLSLQSVAPEPVQVPPLHAELTVHLSLSSHGPLTASWVQPTPVLQASVVHTSLSSQLVGVPPHVVPLQVSLTVQASPSSQLPVVATCVQPLFLSQASVVQGLPSSQPTAATPVQTPAAQLSPLVQASPSSHAAVFG